MSAQSRFSPGEVRRIPPPVVVGQNLVDSGQPSPVSVQVSGGRAKFGPERERASFARIRASSAGASPRTAELGPNFDQSWARFWRRPTHAPRICAAFVTERLLTHATEVGSPNTATLGLRPLLQQHTPSRYLRHRPHKRRSGANIGGKLGRLGTSTVGSASCGAAFRPSSRHAPGPLRSLSGGHASDFWPDVAASWPRKGRKAGGMVRGPRIIPQGGCAFVPPQAAVFASATTERDERWELGDPPRGRASGARRKRRRVVALDVGVSGLRTRHGVNWRPSGRAQHRLRWLMPRSRVWSPPLQLLL